MDKKKNSLVIMDCDGVIVEGDKPAFTKVYSRTLEDAGLGRSEDEVTAIMNRNWGSSDSVIVSAMVDNDPVLAEPLSVIYKANLREMYTDLVTPVEGVADMLGRLAASHYLAINSANDRRVINQLLDKMSVPKGTIDQIITADDLTHPSLAKPHPYVNRSLMELFGTASAATIMVGDSANDIRSAQRAGIAAVAVLTGNLNAAEAGELEADYILPDITYVETDVLPKLMGGIVLKDCLIKPASRALPLQASPGQAPKYVCS